MMVTAVTTQPRFAATTPRALFSRSFAVTSSRVSYDVSPDGQRFVVVGPSESEQPEGQINVVLHWAEELKRLVPPN
jgi:hypothetical protein